MTQQHEHDSGLRLWPYALGGLAVVALSVAAAAGRYYTVSEGRGLWSLLVWVSLGGWWLAALARHDFQRQAGQRDRAGVWLLWVLVSALAASGYVYAVVTAPELPCREPSAYAGFGEPTRVDGREYVLTQAGGEPPRTTAGTESPRPLGEWFVVHGTATNVSERSRRLAPASAVLMVCDIRYQAEAALTTAARSLNPGLTAEFAAVFDVPVGFPNGETVVVRLYGASNYTKVRWDGWGVVASK